MGRERSARLSKLRVSRDFKGPPLVPVLAELEEDEL
jgi:hypothetical protein